MAREIINSDKFEFNDIQRKFTGEFLNEKLKSLYLILPKIGFFFSTLLLVSSLVGFGGMSQFFFYISVLFLFLSGVFAFIMLNERANMACLGIINEARDTQLKYIFGRDKAKIKYYADIGHAVYNFLGKDAKEAVGKNLTLSNKKYSFLVDKKIYTMGYLLPGSTGSGKTVTLNTTVFLPAIKSGNGFFYIEGKGDRPITEGILGFIYQYGRENDVYVLDIGASANGGLTNGLNPLSIGSSKTVGELLKSLITIMTGDNAWVSNMAISYLEAILLPLILLRDLNLIIDSKEQKEIATFKDFEKLEKKQFNITALLDYLNFQSAIDLYYMMNRLFNDRAFLKEVARLEEYNSLKRSLKENIIDRLGRNLTGHNIDITSLTEPDYSKLDADIKRNHPKATDDWISALEVFGSEKFYGNIFNKDESDFEALTAIQTGKIIITILPSMSASEEQNQKMGKMMTSIAKSAIGYMLEQGSLVGERKNKARDKRYRPKKLPYAYVFDEPSNYANTDIASMSSMVRSVGSDGGGMAIVWTGQSRTDADKMDDNKKVASEQLLANLGFTQCLNIQDEGWKQVMVKKTGETYVVREELIEKEKKDGSDPTIRRDKEKKYEENFFENNLRPQTGESIVTVKGYVNEEKVVSNYNEAPPSDLMLNIPISSKKLLNHFKTEEEAEEILQKLREEIEGEIEDLLNTDEKSLSFTKEVREGLSILVNTVYPALIEADNFTLELVYEENAKAHGDYNTLTKHIRIYNAINKSREHLIATGIHEVCHHIEMTQTGETGHSKNFYKILHEMLSYAMGLEELAFNYEEAKAKKMLDSNDIRLMEKAFSTPKVLKR
jgi:hypothetical protein